MVAGLVWAGFTISRWAVLVAVRVATDRTAGSAGVLSYGGVFDVGHFFTIAAAGYTDPTDVAPVRQAFFPGYPALLRGLSLLYTGDVQERGLFLAAFTVTTVSSMAATILVARIAEEEFGRRAGVFAALLLMAWPSATFLTVYYSEPLYLALAAGAWYCGTRGWWWGAGLLCAAASFTRVNGLFLALALLVMLLVAVHRRQEAFGWSKVLGVLTGVLGAAAYLIYLWRITGDALAWSHAQSKGWARETVLPWTSFGNTVADFHNPDSGPYQRIQEGADIASVALGVVAMVWMGVRRRWAELTLTLLTFATLTTSYVYLSIARNTLTLVPIFVLGGGFLARRRAWVAVVVLVPSAVWMLVMTGVVAADQWIG